MIRGLIRYLAWRFFSANNLTINCLNASICQSTGVLKKLYCNTLETFLILDILYSVDFNKAIIKYPILNVSVKYFMGVRHFTLIEKAKIQVQSTSK